MCRLLPQRLAVQAALIRKRAPLWLFTAAPNVIGLPFERGARLF